MENEFTMDVYLRAGRPIAISKDYKGVSIYMQTHGSEIRLVARGASSLVIQAVNDIAKKAGGYSRTGSV